MAPGEFPVTLASKNIQVEVSNGLVTELSNKVFLCLYLYIHVYVFIYVYMYTYVHIYIYMYPIKSYIHQ
jgi:hypothetical protein